MHQEPPELMIETVMSGWGSYRGSLPWKGEVRSEPGSCALESQWPMALGLWPELLAGEGLEERAKGWRIFSEPHLSCLKPVCSHSSLSCLPCQLPAVVPAVLGSKECEQGAGLALNEGDRWAGTTHQCSSLRRTCMGHES